MTRFADKRNDNTIDVELGPCECPPGDDGAKPHETDTVSIYAELGYKALADISTAGHLPDGRFSYYEAKIELLRIGIARWDLRGADGKVMQINKGSIGLMRASDVDRIAAELDKVVDAGEEQVPKAPSAPSATGSAESASSTPTTPVLAQSSTQ